jgi:hypothetical protein
MRYILRRGQVLFYDVLRLGIVMKFRIHVHVEIMSEDTDQN